MLKVIVNNKQNNQSKVVYRLIALFIVTYQFWPNRDDTNYSLEQAN